MQTFLLDHLNKQAINIKIPLQLSDNEGYFLTNKYTEKAILEDVIAALSTRVGERFMNPEFGSNLWNYLFEQTVEELRIKVNQEVRRVIGKYFSSVQVTSVEVLTYEQDTTAPEYGYRVKIKLNIPNIQTVKFDEIMIDFSV